MRRYKQRRDSTTVSLFPFLAVLICTFGVLIVLLVLVVKVADQNAETKKQEIADRHSEEKTELLAAVSMQNGRLTGLKSVRPDLLKKLQQARQKRAHLQSRLNALGDDVEVLNTQIQLVSGEFDIDELQSSDDAIRDLQQQIEEELAQLNERRKAVSSNRPTLYSVVPHDGPGGTQRRPIYVECLKDRLIIQPYEIELTSKDFVQPIVANNPLDAALLAVREYFLENQLNQLGQSPYPLLIVRPSGAQTYSVARYAIRSWDEEFGYELVSGDKQLDFGVMDEQLKQKMQLAIAAARKRQQDYVAAKLLNKPLPKASNANQAGSRGTGLHASKRHGGFVGPNGEIKSKSDLESTNENRDFQASKSDNSSQVSSSNTNFGNGQGDSDTLSIANKKGKNWAVPAHRPQAVGYLRPVVVALNQRDMFITGASQANSIRIPFDRAPSTSVEQLVEQVWSEVDRWGVAGGNGYWKPELVFRVANGARPRYRQIVALMRGSGLNIRESNQ